MGPDPSPAAHERHLGVAGQPECHPDTGSLRHLTTDPTGSRDDRLAEHQQVVEETDGGDIVVEGGITLARHRLLADGLGATVRDAGHVIALDTAAMAAAAAATGAGRPHRRKERIPPGPAALAAAAELTAALTGKPISSNDIPAADTTATVVGTVTDLAAYERAAHGRNTLT